MTKTYKERVAAMEISIKALSEGQDRIEKKIDDFITSADKKYVNKSVEEEFKEFKEYTDKRVDKLSNKLAYFSGAFAILILILQLWRPFG